MWFFKLLFERDLRARHLERKSDERRWQSPGHKSTKFFCDLKHPHSHIPMAIMSSLYMCHVSYWSSKIHDSMLLCEWSGGPPCHRVWFNLILLKSSCTIWLRAAYHNSILYWCPLSLMYIITAGSQLLGHGDYDIHDGCCCWVVGGGMTSKISKIPQMCDIVWCCGDSSNGF